MNRIDQKFADLRARGQKGLVAYITAGDPDLNATKRLAVAMERAGVDVLELGVPFSDPLADGVVNQQAADRALKSGTTLPKILDAVRALRADGCQIPVVLFTYFNPVHRYGVEKFVADAETAGVDGLLALDLPADEVGPWEKMLDGSGLRQIHLIAPTTTDERIAAIAKRASGFIYYVSREGVTGMQQKLAANIATMTAKIHKHTSVPIAVGFGISTPEQARAVAQHAEAVVVGSAIVDRIAKLGAAPDMVEQVSAFVKSLVEAVKGSGH
ncbi:MAG: tryptophan synthase subunit alpha [Verrucomicrobia bacterium]|nr:tryptophan synthase subunit alpha [Verrucomicrobiota bacterium]